MEIYEILCNICTRSVAVDLLLSVRVKQSDCFDLCANFCRVEIESRKVCTIIIMAINISKRKIVNLD